MLVPLTAACLWAAAVNYYLPFDTLRAIMHMEGGLIGQAKQNTDKARSQDLGPFQVNTTWLTTFKIYWGLPDEITVYYVLRDNGCANADAGAAILRYYLQQTGDLDKAVARYHAGPAGSPQEAAKYLSTYKYVMATGHLPTRKQGQH